MEGLRFKSGNVSSMVHHCHILVSQYQTLLTEIFFNLTSLGQCSGKNKAIGISSIEFINYIYNSMNYFGHAHFSTSKGK